MLNLLLIFALTAGAFALVIGLMAVGVLLGRREIKGSCGGLGSQAGKPGESSCSLCSNPEAACRELAQRGQSDGSQEASDVETAVAQRGRSC